MGDILKMDDNICHIIYQFFGITTNFKLFRSQGLIKSYVLCVLMIVFGGSSKWHLDTYCKKSCTSLRIDKVFHNSEPSDSF